MRARPPHRHDRYGFRLVGLALALPRRSKAVASPFGRHGSRSLIPSHRGVNQRAALACDELRRRERHGLGHRLQLGFIGFRQIGAGRTSLSSRSKFFRDCFSKFYMRSIYQVPGCLHEGKILSLDLRRHGNQLPKILYGVLRVKHPVRATRARLTQTGAQAVRHRCA